MEAAAVGSGLRGWTKREGKPYSEQLCGAAAGQARLGCGLCACRLRPKADAAEGFLLWYVGGTILRWTMRCWQPSRQTTRRNLSVINLLAQAIFDSLNASSPNHDDGRE